MGRHPAARVEAAAYGDPHDRVAGRLGGVPPFGRQQLGDPRGKDIVSKRQLEGESGQTGVKAGQMPGQLDGNAPPSTERLEDPSPSWKPRS